MDYLIATDAETGGLDPDEVDLLTIYMAVVDENYKIVEELDLLLKPDGDRLSIAHADALRVTGIDLQAHLTNPNTITYTEAANKITEMLKKYRTKGKYSNLKFCGFNCDFDRSFIYKYLINKKDFEKLVHYKNVDVMEAVDFLKRMSWLPPSVGNLGSCVDHFGLSKGKAHNAREDILMTLEVDKKIKELMDSKKSGGQTLDLISLLESE
jgi:oligoribonuclease (3'-5' exoribonuclease)